MITNPTDIADCLVWLDASDISTLYQDENGFGPSVLNDGDPIGFWEDKTIFNNDFKNYNFTVFPAVVRASSTRPTYVASSYNSKPSIKFTRANANGLFSFFSQMNKQVTVFIVAACETVVNDARLYSRTSSTTDLEFGNFLPVGINNNRYRQFCNSWITQTANPIVPFTFEVITSTVNESDQGIISLNGIGSNSNSTLGLKPSNLLAVHSIGGAPNGTNNFNGHISEIIVYDRNLTGNEMHLVQRYLGNKWNIVVPQAYAIKNGNWSDPLTWVDGTLPLSSDLVFTNTFNVEIDQNINVAGLRTTRVIPKINNSLYSGSFFLRGGDNREINTSQGIQSGRTPCIVNLTTAANVFLTGDIISNSEYSFNSKDLDIGVVEHIGNSQLKIYGNIRGGSNFNYGVYHRSEGDVYVYGNINNEGSGNTSGIYVEPGNRGDLFVVGNVDTGPANSSVGINNSSTTCTVYITGNIIARGGGNFDYGVYIVESGDLIVHGNVSCASTAGSNTFGIFNRVLGSATVYGNLSAGRLGSALFAPSSKNNYIFGSVFNTSSGPGADFQNGGQAILARGYFLTPEAKTTTQYDIAGSPFTFYSSYNYNLTQTPSISDVRLDTSYAGWDFNGEYFDQLVGTIQMPPKECVVVEEPVGAEVGTALLTPDSLKHVWSYLINNINIQETLGMRTKDILTIDTFGQLITSTTI